MRRFAACRQKGWVSATLTAIRVGLERLASPPRLVCILSKASLRSAKGGATRRSRTGQICGWGMQRRTFLALAAGVGAAAPSLARAWPMPAQLRRLDLVNAHTGETFKGPYRDDGGPIADAMGELCYFLRDFHCGERTEIDIGVVDFLASVMEAVGAPRATVLSAYRTPATNAMLARTNFGVAEHSQH